MVWCQNDADITTIGVNVFYSKESHTLGFIKSFSITATLT